MSPPIREGSGDNIGSIRLGDGTEISEVRTGAGDVLFSGNAIPDSAVHHYTFSEGGGTSTKDLIGNADMSLNGISFDNGTWVDDFAGSGSGGSDEGNAPISAFFLNSKWSVSYVFRTTSTSINHLMGVDNGNFTDGVGWRMNDPSSGRIEFTFQQGDDKIRVDFGGSLNDGNKHHIVTTKAGSAVSDCNFYLDGSEVTSFNIQADNNPQPVDPGFPFGFWYLTNFGGHLDAELDDIIFANEIFSQSQVTDLFNRQPWS